MGLSGSGKSTLVRTLIRLIEPTAGKITITGQDVMGADAGELRELRRHSVSMVFQHFGLLAHRRVIDNVAFGLEIQGVSKARAAGARQRGARAGRARGRGQLLPGPALRRHAAARRAGARLRRRPEADALRRAVQRARPADPPRHAGRGRSGSRTETGKTMLFITHDLPEALRLGDRIAIMRDGAIVQLGTPEELVGSPADEYVAELRARHPAHARAHAALDHARPAARRGDATGPSCRVTTTVQGRRAGGGGHRRAGARRRGRPRAWASSTAWRSSRRWRRNPRTPVAVASGRIARTGVRGSHPARAGAAGRRRSAAIVGAACSSATSC